MGIRLCGISALLLGVCVLTGATAAGQDKKGSIESLFEGLPADLRAKVKTNAVRRDKVNDWLREHVNGKGKVVEIRVPVEVTPTRAGDGTYLVQVNVTNATVQTLGDMWYVTFRPEKRVAEKGPDFGKGFGKGFKPTRGGSFQFMAVSAADAEKLADLDQATIQGTVKEAELTATFNVAYLRLLLEDVRVDGKKLTPYKPAEPK